MVEGSGFHIAMETTQTVLADEYLSVVVYLRFLLNVGVELRDIRHIAVRLLTVGVPMAVCKGDREAKIFLFKPVI